MAVYNVSKLVKALASGWLNITFYNQFLERGISFVQHPRTIVSANEHRTDRLI
ncbi:hypothetical protein ABE527_14610 [Brucella sp. TWI432]